MRIAVDIVVSEQEWFEWQRAVNGPFVPIDNEVLQESLSHAVVAWAGRAINAVTTRILCGDSTHSHQAGGCCEPGPTVATDTVDAELIRDLKARVMDLEIRDFTQDKQIAMLEEWAARQCDDWKFDHGSLIDRADKEDISNLHDRISDLESRLPVSE